MRLQIRRISYFFFFNDTATTEIYTRPYTLSLHDALPISRLVAHGDDPDDPGPRCEPQGPQVRAHLLGIGGIGQPGKVGILVEASKTESGRADVDHSDRLHGLIAAALQGQLVGHHATGRRLILDVVNFPGADPEPRLRPSGPALLVEPGDGRKVECRRQLGKAAIEAEVPIARRATDGRGHHSAIGASRCSRPTVCNRERSCSTAADRPPRSGWRRARTGGSLRSPLAIASASVPLFTSSGSSASTHPLFWNSRARVRCSALGPGRGINNAGVDDRRISIVVL